MCDSGFFRDGHFGGRPDGVTFDVGRSASGGDITFNAFMRPGGDISLFGSPVKGISRCIPGLLARCHGSVVGVAHFSGAVEHDGIVRSRDRIGT